MPVGTEGENGLNGECLMELHASQAPVSATMHKKIVLMSVAACMSC
jgi:hypothetical protein